MRARGGGLRHCTPDLQAEVKRERDERLRDGG